MHGRPWCPQARCFTHVTALRARKCGCRTASADARVRRHLQGRGPDRLGGPRFRTIRHTSTVRSTAVGGVRVADAAEASWPAPGTCHRSTSSWWPTARCTSSRPPPKSCWRVPAAAVGRPGPATGAAPATAVPSHRGDPSCGFPPRCPGAGRAAGEPPRRPVGGSWPGRTCWCAATVGARVRRRRPPRPGAHATDLRRERAMLGSAMSDGDSPPADLTTAPPPRCRSSTTPWAAPRSGAAGTLAPAARCFHSDPGGVQRLARRWRLDP